MRTLIKNIGVLATATGSAAKSGTSQGEITQLRDAYVVIENDKIAEVGTGTCQIDNIDAVTDADGRLVTAGLVDAHTHLIFGGWRENELALKLKGVSYLDILKSGGGILYTLEHTRKATEDELFCAGRSALSSMLKMGTTTCEAKSGYCLNLEGEVKQLRVIHRLNCEQPVSLVPTFMAAHAVPKEFSGNSSAYVDEIINHMLPVISDEQLAEYCDVFCETGVFSVEEARKVLTAAKGFGLKAKIHADEIDAIGGSTLSGEIGAVSAEHLIAIDECGMDAMSKNGVIADLLPATSFYLDKPFAPARELISRNIPVVIATDFNPGSCPSLSLQFAMNLGCYKYKMTPEEVLTAVTLNAAASLNRAGSIGTVEPDKDADLVIWDAPNLNYIFYRFGSNLVHTTIKSGIFYN